VYKINEVREDLTVGENLNDLDFQKLANSASVLEIIKKQTERYDFFTLIMLTIVGCAYMRNPDLLIIN